MKSAWHTSRRGLTVNPTYMTSRSTARTMARCTPVIHAMVPSLWNFGGAISILVVSRRMRNTMLNDAVSPGSPMDQRMWLTMNGTGSRACEYGSMNSTHARVPVKKTIMELSEMVVVLFFCPVLLQAFARIRNTARVAISVKTVASTYTCRGHATPHAENASGQSGPGSGHTSGSGSGSALDGSGSEVISGSVWLLLSTSGSLLLDMIFQNDVTGKRRTNILFSFKYTGL